MMVGTKAIATLSTGYLNALDYAKTRVQSADLTQAARQDRAARDDHQPPRRAPQPDAEQGLRRGPARAGLLHRVRAGPHHRRRARRHRHHAGRGRSTTCCCRSSRASAPSAPTTSSPRRCRPSAARATCRTTRSSSTSATPRSTPCTRARPRSRRRTSSSARSSATRAPRSARCRPRSPSSSSRSPTRAGSRRTRAALQKALEDFGGIVGAMFQPADERPGGRHATSTRSARTPPACCMSAGDLMVGYLLLRQAVGRADQARRATASRPPTAPSTRASRPSRASSPRPCCPSWPPAARSPSAIDNSLMDVPEAAF